MKVYKGFTASPGLVLGQVSRLDRPPLVFGEGPFHPEQEKQALEDAIKVAQQELDEMAGRAAPSEQAIFLFQSMMLEDEGFMNEVAFQIKQELHLHIPFFCLLTLSILCCVYTAIFSSDTF